MVAEQNRSFCEREVGREIETWGKVALEAASKLLRGDLTTQVLV